MPPMLLIPQQLAYSHSQINLNSNTPQVSASLTTIREDVAEETAVSLTPAMPQDVTRSIQPTHAPSLLNPVLPPCSQIPQGQLRPNLLPTPIRAHRLSHYLRGYDPSLTRYLVNGFSYGFTISSLSVDPNDPSKNLHSAYQYPQVVNKKLSSEMDLGRIAGPFKSPPLPDMVFSPLGLQPKKVQGQFRVIHHLSYPQGHSVNDGIPREYASVKYASVGQAIQQIVQVGQGCFLAKTDVKSAFRIIPVNPKDYHLLGFYWEGQYFYDKCLPMGCSSSCSIFEAFSTSLEWIIKQRLTHVSVLHILDDFLFIAPTLKLCSAALSLFEAICRDIGYPSGSGENYRPISVPRVCRYTPRYSRHVCKPAS